MFTEDYLNERLNVMLHHTGKIVKHYNRDLYQIIGLTEHTETGEICMAYRALYGDCKIHNRPIKMFLERLPKEFQERYKQEHRFEIHRVESVKLD